MIKRESDANAELAKRVDAARRACCDDSDGLDPARGIVIAMPIGIALWVVAIVVAVALWGA